MRLSYSLFETPIIFNENQVNVVVIENQKAFTDFAMALRIKCDGGEAECSLFKNFEEVKFDKFADVVTDIITLDCNNKKIISRLYSKLNEIAFQEENYTLTLEMLSKINEYLLTITNSLPCEINFDENIELGVLFKGVSLRVDMYDGSLLDKLCNYIEMMNEFCKVEVFIFINLKSFFNVQELAEFYKFVNYKKINVLLVENVCRDSIDGENIKIIDNDLCEIS